MAKSKSDTAYAEALRCIAACRQQGNQGIQLDLSNLGLTTLPPEIGQLTSLTELNLYGNQLTTLPPEIGQLTALTALYLHDNHLSTLPPEIGQLTALTMLRLYGNHLTTLPPEIGQLTAMTELELANNQFTTLPPEIGQLTALTDLYFYDNKLTTLPPEIGQLTALMSLYLHINQLTTLPILLGKLPQLKYLNILDNPLPAELIKLAEGDSSRLIEYLRELAKAADAAGEDAARRFDEAKLLLVGPGEVGKTWLLRALQGQTPEPTASTKGIEIAREPLDLPHPTETGRSLHLNCWDFGGQDYYQITHQIFFSTKAVYLLVWKPRTGLDPELLQRLERIRLSAGRTAKVLIVSTHADKGVPAIIGKEALQEQFGNLIWGFYETDSVNGANGTGIAALKDAIAQAAAQLEGMDLPVPPAWHTDQRAIRSRRKNKKTLTFAEFAEVCHEKGQLDAASAADVANIMEVQGHVVFFADATADGATGRKDADNLVVLDPEWLAKAIGFVLEDDATNKQSGSLHHDRLKTIWKKETKRSCPGYGKELHGYLLWLMWKFDIAYRQNEQTSLVPELIQRNRPDDLHWTPATSSQEPQATLICRFPTDPPLGLIPALTAAVHPLRRIQNPEPLDDKLDRNWRDGFFLDTALRGTAFVELLDRDLRIVVRDKYPADLSRQVEKTLDRIVGERWPQLLIDARVPCVGKVQDKPCRGTFRKSVLEQRRGQNIFCEDCGNDALDVTKLLDGFDFREEEILRQLHALELGQQQLLTGQQELMAASYRLFQQALDPDRNERERAPCMFTILPAEAKSWQLLSKLAEHKLRVTCWCEHPDGPHPGALIGSDQPPDYVLTMPKEWLVKAAPYISWAATLLKAFVPLAGTMTQQIATAGAFLTPDLKDQIALMNDAIKTLPSGKLEAGRRDELEEIRGRKPEMVALRHIHDALLAQVKEQRRWGDLRPVRTKSGELLWLCEQHAAIQQPPVQKDLSGGKSSPHRSVTGQQ